MNDLIVNIAFPSPSRQPAGRGFITVSPGAVLTRLVFTTSLIFCLFLLKTKAQDMNTMDKWTGYWIESTQSGFSCPTILVFDNDGADDMSGMMYVLKKDRQPGEYVLKNITVCGDSLSFDVQNTAISFSCVLSETKADCKGEFLLGGRNKVSVGHVRASWEEVQDFFRKANSAAEKMIKREIDATEGYCIG